MSEQWTGERIRALRKRLGISQIELAALLAVSNVTVNRWEHDRAVPQPATTDRLRRAERDGLAALTGETPPLSDNLPYAATPLLGRVEELRMAGQLLVPGAVVTLTGPGGIGKTRLAPEIAARRREHFDDGVWFVDLSAVSDPAAVGHTVARLLGLRTSSLSQTLMDSCRLLSQWCRIRSPLPLQAPHLLLPWRTMSRTMDMSWRKRKRR